MKALCLLLLTTFVSLAQAIQPAVTISLGDASGYPDIYVTHFGARSHAGLHWAEPSLTNEQRRVARIPLRVTANRAWVGPVFREAPGAFGRHTGLRTLCNSFSVTIIDDSSGQDVDLRRNVGEAPWVGLGHAQIGLAAGQSAYVSSRMCWLDTTGIENGSYLLFVEFDPLNLWDAYANAFFVVTIKDLEVTVW